MATEEKLKARRALLGLECRLVCTGIHGSLSCNEGAILAT